MKKILIIGNGSQSKRIQNILKKMNYKFSIFYYKIKKNSYISSALKSDIIFVCSPNRTHYHYINKISKNKKYIFCEKPPVNNKSELKKMYKKYYGKIYFNYNYRLSSIGKIFSKLKEFKLRKLISANIYMTHGLASKKTYKSSWRSDKKLCPKGIFEIVTIHILDILNFYFKIKKINKINLNNLSKIGNSYDTVDVQIEMSNNSIVNIFNTYFGPYYSKWNMIFENGIIEINNNNLIIRGPRNTFDKDNNFILPNIIKRIRLLRKKDYENSLKNSVKFFLEYAKRNKKFKRHHYFLSLDSNKLIL